MLFMLFVVLIIASTTRAAGTSAYDSFLVNCGLPKSQTATSQDNRVWLSDDGAAFTPPNINDVSSAVTAFDGDSGQTPYSHARIFRSSLTYSFPVSPGPKFIRLYFSTSTTIAYNISASQSFISLKANGFTLFHNFSAYLNSRFLPLYFSGGSFIEFYVLVQNEKISPTTLNLTFSPPGSGTHYGFVNGIEIVPVPDGLYINSSINGTPYYVNNPDTGYTLQSTTSFQTAYRLNVGGGDVQAKDDAGMLGRTWYKDDRYVFGGFDGKSPYPTTGKPDAGVMYRRVSPDAAPKIVYATLRIIGFNPPEIRIKDKMNLTWEFWLDPGFDYLLRLHFCEMDSGVTASSTREFEVFFNNLMADKDVNVWDLSGGRGSPIYKDYIFHVDGGAGDYGVGATNITTGKAQLLLALLPLPISEVKDVLLNGLEILKLNQLNGSLAAPNPPSSIATTAITSKDPDRSRNGAKHHSVAIIGGAVGGAIMVALVTFLCLCRQRGSTKNKETKLPFWRSIRDKSKRSNWVPVASLVSGSTTTTDGSSLPSDLCRRFSLAQIRVATSDFDESTVIGTGGFGKVYKGVINDGATIVAIKRLNPSSKQGAHEFRTEIEMLSRLRHLHLVSLIGYCEDHGEMILVYEYMPHGTLRDHLMYKNNNDNTITPLSWKQRLMICAGSARGLHYLHAGTKELIIHRDVKPTNILLDEKWTAKVSDFGLSKVGPSSESGDAHVSTAVKGSIGYLDPEYYKRQRLTEKSDVYSFGVVLFEVLCARPAANPSLPKEQVNLAKWARRCYKNGTLHTIVDPNLTGQIAPESLSKFGEIAEMCVRDEGSQRPLMGDVVWALEFALELQETADKNNINGGPSEGMLGPTIASNGGDGGTTDDDIFSATGENLSNTSGSSVLLSNDHAAMRSGSIFSEIMNPKAR